MKNLLKNQLENKYISYIDSLPFQNSALKEKFIDLLKTKDAQQRLNKWQNFSILPKDIKELSKFSNPYYVGFGNPDSDILFLGKEKAFNITDNPDLFLFESIDNILHWETIQKAKIFDPKIKFYETSDFNPIFPRLHHNSKFSKRHTWGVYAQIISLLRQLDHSTLINETDNYEQSLFKHCFMSEINHIPSKYSYGNKKINDERKAFLSNDFYKGFKYVFIGANGYITQSELENIFEAKTINQNYKVGEIGTKEKRTLSVDILKSEKQTIVLSGQLSGAGGWTTESIVNIVAAL